MGEMTLQQAAGFQALMRVHWPGLLTCAVPLKAGSLGEAFAAETTVWIRIPDCPFLTEFTQMIPQHVLAARPARQEELASADFVLTEASLPEKQEDTVVQVLPNGQIIILHQGTLHLSL